MKKYLFNILDKKFEELRRKLHHKNTDSVKNSLNLKSQNKAKKKKLSNDIESLVYQNVVHR